MDIATPLVTDLYEVTMALAYLKERVTAPATFSLFARALPAERGFLVAAGLAQVVDALIAYRVDDQAVEGFAAALGRPTAEVAPLRGLEFTGDVHAVPEGRVVFAGEPLLEVTAPLPQAQMVETFALNQITHQTALAAKAARSVLAAAGKPVIDFGLRRSHGVEAGMHAARACALVGFRGTSNVAAALAYGLRASGTMAHSFVEAFPDEACAFAAFARTAPGPVTLLVDTYDTERGSAGRSRCCAGCRPTGASGSASTAATSARWPCSPVACSTTPDCIAPTSSPAAASTSTPSRTWSRRARRSTCSPSAPRSTPAPMLRTSTPRTSSSPTTDAR